MNVNSNVARKVRAFGRRIRSGELGPALYLAYYYTYLSALDVIQRTSFSNSTPPRLAAGHETSTGNFPCHPRMLRRFLSEMRVPKSTAIVDIGSGSGAALYAAWKAGYANLTGIEYDLEACRLSISNLGDRAKIICGDATEFDLSPFGALLFYSPFRGDPAQVLFTDLPANVKSIVTVNHDPVIEPLLVNARFQVTYQYRHRLYRNFNGKVWKRS